MLKYIQQFVDAVAYAEACIKRIYTLFDRAESSTESVLFAADVTLQIPISLYEENNEVWILPKGNNRIKLELAMAVRVQFQRIHLYDTWDMCVCAHTQLEGIPENLCIIDMSSDIFGCRWWWWFLQILCVSMVSVMKIVLSLGSDWHSIMFWCG